MTTQATPDAPFSTATAFSLGTEAFDRDMREYGRIPIFGVASKIVRLAVNCLGTMNPAEIAALQPGPSQKISPEALELIKALVDEVAAELAKMHVNIGLGTLAHINAREPEPTTPITPGPSDPQ
jgi:hypothetical protein